MGSFVAKLLVILVLLQVFSFSYFTSSVRASDACDDNSPTSKPVLISAIPSANSVTLTWTEAQDPVTHYLVAYGRSETKIEYGNPNVGNRGTTTYTVGELTNGVKYYFKVRPINGCRPGDFSNKLSAIPGITTRSGATNVTSGGHTPNLSIYKSNINTDIQTTSSASIEKTKIPSAMVDNSLKCLTCVGWPLLIAEVVLLIVFLYLASNNAIFKPIFSLAIPILIYILFWRINQNCLKSTFICKYFLPLEVIAFIFIEIAYKVVKSGLVRKN